MHDIDKFEQSLSDLGVNVWDIKEQDAHWRNVELLARCYNRINNLTVENEELKKTWEKNMATIAKLKRELREIEEEYPEA